MTGGPDSLTPRQRQALAAVTRTGSVKIAAHELGIAPRTVKWHVAAAKSRLYVDTFTQAVLVLAGAQAAIAEAAPLDSYPDDEPRATLAPMITNGPDLRAARRRAGLTQDELAARLGLCRQRVAAAEGSTHVSPAFAARCAAALVAIP